MKPVSPVVPGAQDREVKIKGKGSLDLPAVLLGDKEGTIMTRWRPTEEEKELLRRGADVLVFIKTFGQPVLPMLLQVDESPEMRLFLGEGGKGKKSGEEEGKEGKEGLIQ